MEYTKSELENKANQFLRSRVDVPFRAPIDVELLLENTSNVTLQTLAGLTNKFGVEGAVCNHANSQDITVFVDLNIANGHSDARYAAVIGEELAHIELHRPLIIQVRSVHDFIEVRKHSKWRMIERDARRYSAALRMPKMLVDEQASSVYREIVDEHGFGNTPSLQKLLRNRLAEVFCVSYEEMHSRLLEWPLEIYERMTTSILAHSPNLMGRDATITINTTLRQRMLYEWPVDD